MVDLVIRDVFSLDKWTNSDVHMIYFTSQVQREIHQLQASK